MQIHELTQPGKPQLDEVFDTARAIWNNPKSLISSRALSQVQPTATNAQAARAAAKLSKQGFTGEGPGLEQALAKFQQNPAAQQWVNSIVAKWPAQAQKMKTPTTPVTEDEPVYLPGSKTPLDPDNPRDAQVLAAMSKQGLTPPVATKTVSSLPNKKRKQNTTTTVTPGAPSYRDQFRQWVNQELKTISLDSIEQAVPELATRLEKIMDEIVANQNNLPAQQKLVHDFFSLAVAGNHVARQQSSLGTGYGTKSVVDNTGSALPLDAASELKLKQELGRAGVRRLRSTRNPAVDGMLQKLGITITP